MKGWPFAEAARKTIDFDDYLHQKLRQLHRDIDDRVAHETLYGDGSNQTKES